LSFTYLKTKSIIKTKSHFTGTGKYNSRINKNAKLNIANSLTTPAGTHLGGYKTRLLLLFL